MQLKLMMKMTREKTTDLVAGVGYVPSSFSSSSSFSYPCHSHHHHHRKANRLR